MQLNRVRLACDCSSGWIKQFFSRNRIKYSRQMADWISDHRNEWLSWTDSERSEDVSSLLNTNHSLTYWQVMHVHLEKLQQLQDDLSQGFCSGHSWLSFSTPTSSRWAAEEREENDFIDKAEILVSNGGNREESHHKFTFLSALRNELQNCRNCSTSRNKIFHFTVLHFLFVWCFHCLPRASSFRSADICLLELFCLQV